MTPEQITKWRATADLDARAGEPVGKALREAADEVERLTAQVTAMAEENTRLVAKVADQAEDVMFLEALQAAGVDNWDGYSFAHEIFDEWQGGETP